MADAQANINLNIDSSKALAQLKMLQRGLSDVYSRMATGGAAANQKLGELSQNLVNSVNATGKFSASMTTVSSSADSFTNALEKNKLSMRQYFRFAAGSTKTFGKVFTGEFNTIEKVARERVKTLQTQYIKMGRDATGAIQAIKVRPLALDMNNLSTQVMMASQKQQIFNQLLKQGSTNLLNFGKNTQWAGRQLMVGFTVPLTIMGGIAIREFQKIEEQVVKFKRVYGGLFTTSEDTEKALNNVRRLAEEFTKYGIAVEKTIDLAAKVAQMGNVGQALETQVTQATRLSVLGGMEQMDALDTTISLTNAFGVAIEDLGEKINFLNAAENQTILAIQDFNTAIPLAGSVVQQLGGSVEDLAFFLTAMREGGINASQAGNALKSSLGRLIAPSRNARDTLAGFGIDVMGIVEQNAGNLKQTVMVLARELDKLDPLSRARSIEALFGKFQFARMSTLFQNITKEGSQANKVLELAGKSTQELAILAERELKRVEDSPLFKFQKQLEQLQAALAPIGEEFLKLVTPIIEFAGKILKSFNNLGDGAKQMGLIIVAGLGVVAPTFLMLFGLMANGLANLIKAIGKLGSFFDFLAGKSKIAGSDTNYLNSEMLESQAIASSLEQAHQRLQQVFSSESQSIRDLAAAYERAAIAAGAFAGARMPGPAASKGGAAGNYSPFMPPKQYADGVVMVPGPKGAGDVVPAMLSPGEAVIPAEQTKKYLPLIKGMISDNIPGFSTGGNLPTGISSATAMIASEGMSLEKIQILDRTIDKLVKSLGAEKVEAALSELSGTISSTSKLLKTDEYKSLQKERMDVLRPGDFTHVGSDVRMKPSEMIKDPAYAKMTSGQQQIVQDAAKFAPNAEVRATHGYGYTLKGRLNTALNVQEGQTMGADASEVVEDFASTGVSKWTDAIAYGGGDVSDQELMSEFQEYDNRLTEILRKAAERKIAQFVDTAEDKARLVAASGVDPETVGVIEDYEAEAAMGMGPQASQVRKNARSRIRDVRVNYNRQDQEMILAAAEDGDTRAKSLADQMGLGRDESGNFVKTKGKKTFEARASTSTSPAPMPGTSSPAEDGVDDGKEYLEARESVIQNQDPYPSSTDRDSPHRQARPDGEDDAKAYLDGRDSVLSGKDAYPSSSLPPRPGSTDSGIQPPLPPQVDTSTAKRGIGKKALNMFEDSFVGKGIGKFLAKQSGVAISDSKGEVYYDPNEDPTTWAGKMTAEQRALQESYEQTAIAAQKAASSVDDHTDSLQQNDVAASSASSSGEDLVQGIDGRMMPKSEADALARNEQKKQARAKAGKIGFAAMSVANIGIGMATQREDKIGEVARAIMPLTMALNMLPMLFSALGGPITAVVAGLGLLVFGIYKYIEIMNKARTAGIELAQSMSSSADKIQKISEFTGTVSASELRSRERQDLLTGMDRVVDPKFGENFLASEPGKEMMEDIERMRQAGLSMSEISSAMARNLTNAMLQGVLDIDQARSIVAQLGLELKDFSIPLQITAEMSSLVGPNGKNLLDNPLELSVILQTEAIKQQEDAAEKLLEARENLNVFSGTETINDAAKLGGIIGAGVLGVIGGVAGGIAGIVGGPAGIAVGAALGAAKLGSVGAAVGTGVGAGMGLNKEQKELAGTAVSLGIEALNLGQQQLDIVDRTTREQREQLEQSLEIAKNEEQRKSVLEDIERLERRSQLAREQILEGNEKIIKQLTEQRDALGNTEFNKIIEEIALARYEGTGLETLAKKASEELAKFGSTEEEIAFRVNLQAGFAGGDLDFSTIGFLVDAAKENEDLVTEYNIATKTFGTADANVLVQLLQSAGALPETYTYFFKAINEDPDSLNEMLEGLSILNSVNSMYGFSIEVDGEKGVENVREISKAVLDLQEMPDTIEKEALIKEAEEGNKTAQSFLESWEAILGERDTVSKSMILQYETLILGDEELVDWYIANTDEEQRVQGFFDLNVDVKKSIAAEEFLRQYGDTTTRISDDSSGFGNLGVRRPRETSGGGGGGGGKQSSVLDTITKQLRDLRDAQIEVTNGWVESRNTLDRLFGNGQTLSIFSGLEQQMRRFGASESLIQLIVGMDPEEFERRKRELFVFDGEGNIRGLTNALVNMGKALNAIEIGKFQSEQEKALRDVNSQIIAFRKLRNAGLSVALAYEAVKNSAFAAAIAQEKSNKVIKKAVAQMKEATESARSFQAAQATAMQNQQAVDLRGVVKFIEDNARSLSQAQREAILNDPNLQILIMDPSIDPKTLRQALQNAADKADLDLRIGKLTFEGLVDIFRDGFAKAMEAFAAQETKIRIAFDILKDPYLKQIREIEEEISDIRNQEGGLSDLEADLERISRKEQEINEKYDERSKALQKVADINAEIAQRQKSQLDVADALARGDIAGAAKAAQEQRRQQAQQRISEQQKTLDAAKEKELQGLIGKTGKTRKQLEEEIKKLNEEIFDIEQERLRPAQRAVELLERQEERLIESVTILGKTKKEWEAIQNEVDIAVTTSDKFTQAMQNALDVVEDIVKYWDGFEDKAVDLFVNVKERRVDLPELEAAGEGEPAAPESSGGGGGGGEEEKFLTGLEYEEFLDRIRARVKEIGALIIGWFGDVAFEKGTQEFEESLSALKTSFDEVGTRGTSAIVDIARQLSNVTPKMREELLESIEGPIRDIAAKAPQTFAAIASSLSLIPEQVNSITAPHMEDLFERIGLDNKARLAVIGDFVDDVSDRFPDFKSKFQEFSQTVEDNGLATPEAILAAWQDTYQEIPEEYRSQMLPLFEAMYSDLADSQNDHMSTIKNWIADTFSPAEAAIVEDYIMGAFAAAGEGFQVRLTDTKDLMNDISAEARNVLVNEIEPTLTEAAETIRDSFIEGMDIRPALQDQLPEIRGYGEQAGQEIVDGAQDVIDQNPLDITVDSEGAREAGEEAGQEASEAVEDNFLPDLSIDSGRVDFSWTSFEIIGEELGDSVVNGFDDSVSGLGDSVTRELENSLSSINNIKSALDSIDFSKIDRAVSEISSGVKKISEEFNKIPGNINNSVSSEIPSKFEAATTSAITSVKKIETWFKEDFVNSLKTMTETTIPALFTALEAKIREIMDKLKDYFSTLGTTSGNNFKNKFESVLNNMRPKLEVQVTYKTSGSVPPGVRSNNGGYISRNDGGDIRRNIGGMASAFPMGGTVPGFGNYDNVPALLTPGEFVIRREAVQTYGRSLFESLNSTVYEKPSFKAPNFDNSYSSTSAPTVSPEKSSSVYNSNYEINVNVKSESNPDEIANTVIKHIKRIDSQRIRGNRI